MICVVQTTFHLRQQLLRGSVDLIAISREPIKSSGIHTLDAFIVSGPRATVSVVGCGYLHFFAIGSYINDGTFEKWELLSKKVRFFFCNEHLFLSHHCRSPISFFSLNPTQFFRPPEISWKIFHFPLFLFSFSDILLFFFPFSCDSSLELYSTHLLLSAFRRLRRSISEF